MEKDRYEKTNGETVIDLRTVDATVTVAKRDVATVTKTGETVDTSIYGVKTRSVVTHMDHRGSVFEIFNEDPDYWTEPAVYNYQFSIFPGNIKGWGLHEFKIDRYTLTRGDVLTLLYDARTESPTHGLVQKVVLSERGVRQLTIPTHVWHINIALGNSESILVNHPTKTYVHDNPDRLLLPFDTTAIPADVRSFFPPQRKGMNQPQASDSFPC